MTGLGKVVFVIGILAVGLGGWGWWNYSNNKAPVPIVVQQTAATTSANTADVTAQAAAQAALHDTSDATLANDLATIDAKIDIATSESASVDKGVNDKPIQQGQ